MYCVCSLGLAQAAFQVRFALAAGRGGRPALWKSKKIQKRLKLDCCRRTDQKRVIRGGGRGANRSHYRCENTLVAGGRAVAIAHLAVGAVAAEFVS